MLRLHSSVELQPLRSARARALAQMRAEEELIPEAGGRSEVMVRCAGTLGPKFAVRRSSTVCR